MTTATREQTDKEQLLDKVSQFPDTASFEDMSETIAILAALRRSEAELDEGQFVTNEEAMKRTAKWIIK